MAWYRLYQLRGGRILSGADFEADDDAAALRHANENVGFESVEVWSGARCVGMIAAPDNTPRAGCGTYG